MRRKQFIRGSAIVSAYAVMNPFSFASCGMIVTGDRSRKVLRVLNTTRELVGTLPILRAFAGDQNDYVSPFVLFDEFGPVDITAGSEPLRVKAHPHAGITPTTYFIDGAGHHVDSLNYNIQVTKGEFMMFSSGRGAIHMEETGQKLYDSGGKYHGFQIWLNNPARDKFAVPETYVYRQNEIPVIQKRDYTAHVVLGELFGTRSPAQTFSPAFYYYFNMKEGARVSIPVEAHHNAFVYQMEGRSELKDQVELKQHQLALYERGKEEVDILAREDASLLVLGGQPLNEPVFSYGPFVMNTEDQIRQCIANYQSGKMGNPALVR